MLGGAKDDDPNSCKSFGCMKSNEEPADKKAPAPAPAPAPQAKK